MPLPLNMLMVDKKGNEFACQFSNDRVMHSCDASYDMVQLPKGSIEKMIGKKLIYSDEPFIYEL